MEHKTNKTVFLTGATKGLGKLLAQSLHRDGFTIIASDLYPAEEIPEQVAVLFHDYFPFDLSNTLQIGDLTGQITSRHKIDILINNAAILDFRFLSGYEDQEIQRTIQVNLVSPILLVKNFMPHFIENDYGRIINISSSSSFRGFETGTVYTSTKAGLNLFKESFHKELRILRKKKGVDITINNVCPSRINTEEYLTENPGVDPGSLVSPERVFQAIRRLIDSKQSGRMVTIFDSKFRRKLLKKDIQRFFKTQFFSLFS
jgi:NAD(P)-dependent dehydrogenase (short-subunit alcohol dehydrogenase family)